MKRSEIEVKTVAGRCWAARAQGSLIWRSTRPGARLSYAWACAVAARDVYGTHGAADSKRTLHAMRVYVAANSKLSRPKLDLSKYLDAVAPSVRRQILKYAMCRVLAGRATVHRGP